jgi:hypothetical protein
MRRRRAARLRPGGGHVGTPQRNRGLARRRLHRDQFARLPAMRRRRHGAARSLTRQSSHEIRPVIPRGPGCSVRRTPNGHDRTCLSDVFAAVPSATRSRSTRSRRSNHSCGWPTRSPSAWRRRPAASRRAEHRPRSGARPADHEHLLGDPWHLNPTRDSPWRAHRRATFRVDASTAPPTRELGRRSYDLSSRAISVFNRPRI